MCIYDADAAHSGVNQIAAMPSLHFGWAVMVAVSVVAIQRTRRSCLLLLHPAVTLLAIVATGNHYWLDAAVALLLVIITATALQELLRYYAKGRTFDQVFKCNPEEDYYGYKSYEEFFNRQYANVQTDRPTGPIEDLRIIGTPCESVTYCYQENLKVMDELFIKDEAYSLRHLLADNYVEYFKGGTALQSFLNTPDYHRWHAPCNGIIKKIVPVAGTYFAQSPDTIGLPTNPTGKNDPAPPYLQSLTFFANTATRALIFIEAENPKLGCVCFIGIGMTEISSCEATVYEGQKVVRGDELGMFHFGGSSCLILFRKDANVQVDKEYKVPDTRMEINKPFATCDF